MHVLPVFESTIEARNQRDVFSVVGQRLQRRSQLERIDSRNVLDPPAVFNLVRFEASNESRQFGILFAWEEASPATGKLWNQ